MKEREQAKILKDAMALLFKVEEEYPYRHAKRQIIYNIRHEINKAIFALGLDNTSLWQKETEEKREHDSTDT